MIVIMRTWAKVAFGVALLGSFGSGVAFGRKVPAAGPTPTIPSTTDTAPVIDTNCATTQLRVLNIGKPVVWAALGDSYSAGVGGPLNQQLWGQDIFNAYSVFAVQRVKANDALKIQLNLGACGGAKIAEIVSSLTAATVGNDLKSTAGLDAHWWASVPPTLRGLQEADVASVTLGGNDVGFGSIAKQCALSECDDIADGGPAGDVPGASPDAQWSAVRDRLVNAYVVMRDLMKDEGTLFVLDYPIPFDDVSRAACAESLGLGTNDVALVNLFTSRLDATIAEAVQLANQKLNDDKERPGNIALVPWHTSIDGVTPTYDYTLDGQNYVSKVPFNPGGLCSSTPMTLGFGPFEKNREFGDTFHPSAEGVRIAACRLGLAVSKLPSLHLAQPAFVSSGC